MGIGNSSSLNSGGGSSVDGNGMEFSCLLILLLKSFLLKKQETKTTTKRIERKNTHFQCYQFSKEKLTKVKKEGESGQYGERDRADAAVLIFNEVSTVSLFYKYSLKDHRQQLYKSFIFISCVTNHHIFFNPLCFMHIYVYTLKCIFQKNCATFVCSPQPTCNREEGQETIKASLFVKIIHLLQVLVIGKINHTLFPAIIAIIMVFRRLELVCKMHKNKTIYKLNYKKGGEGKFQL